MFGGMGDKPWHLELRAANFLLEPVRMCAEKDHALLLSPHHSKISVALLERKRIVALSCFVNR